MLLFPSDVEPPPLTQIGQVVSFLAVYLMVLAKTSLVLPRWWFMALMKIAHPILAREAPGGKP